MLDIEYKGGNTVVFGTKRATLVVDPKLSVVGGKDVVLKDVIELVTESRFEIDNENAQLRLEGPGEYEVANFSVRGVGARRHIDTEEAGLQTTMYRIEVGDIRIALLGNVAEPLSDDQLEALGVVDIVVLPVGGNGYTLDATSAASIVRAIDPKAVIPVHYADTALKYEVPQDSVQSFVTELGAPTETVNKYKLKSAASLPAVLTTIVVER